MDHTQPRKELQGPRPTPLKVKKDSYKIKKPPIAPPLAVARHQQPPQQPPRKPVIIYTVSPKVIHANPSEFMTLVQRLTGPDSTSSSSTTTTTTTSFQYPSPSCLSSYEVVNRSEMTKMPLEDKRLTGSSLTSRVMEGEVIENINDIGGGGGGVGGVEKTVVFPGILSPGPGSLPQISPNLFSHFLNDPSIINLHHDLSPVQHGNMPSPFANNNFMISPNTTFSPSSLDLLHHILNN